MDFFSTLVSLLDRSQHLLAHRKSFLETPKALLMTSKGIQPCELAGHCMAIANPATPANSSASDVKVHETSGRIEGCSFLSVKV